MTRTTLTPIAILLVCAATALADPASELAAVSGRYDATFAASAEAVGRVGPARTGMIEALDVEPAAPSSGHDEASAPAARPLPRAARVAVRPSADGALMKITVGDATMQLASAGPSGGTWRFVEWVRGPIEGKQRRVTSDRATVYAGSSSDSEAIATLRKGQCLPQVDRKKRLGGSWYKLRLPDGREGWVKSRKLERARGEGLVPGGSLELTPAGDGWIGTASGLSGGWPDLTVSLERRRRALIVPSNDDRDGAAFAIYARRVATYYTTELGFVEAPVVVAGKIEDIIDALQAAAQAGKPFDRVVFIAHGGWDGPSFGEYRDPGARQASAGEGPFKALIAAVRAGTTPSARLYSSACHSGGSNRFELAAEGYVPVNTYVWAEDLGASTGRLVAGPSGITSTEYTLAQVKAVLERDGSGAAQETHVYSPDGGRRLLPGQRW